jgi:hypothetical protein
MNNDLLAAGSLAHHDDARGCLSGDRDDAGVVAWPQTGRGQRAEGAADPEVEQRDHAPPEHEVDPLVGVDGAMGSSRCSGHV